MKTILKTVFFLELLILPLLFSHAQDDPEPVPALRLGIHGLSHSHVNQLLRRPPGGDIQIVGIAETDRKLAERLSNEYGFSMDLVYPDLKAMLKEARPQAVAAFNSIYGHLETVQECGPLGIHVMVEKPLAVNLEHAKQMEEIVKEHGIHLITNYETSWYPTHHRIYSLVHEEETIGELRKIIVCDGHKGPREIGVNEEFLDWLCDPVLNGGGAIIDFGCYGANLITWLMQGEMPLSVLAVTQQIKPEVYPKVDDEATIILTYPHAQGIIQASWNWPFSRKDMEVYGVTGYVKAKNAVELKTRFEQTQEESAEILSPMKGAMNDPFSYLAAIIEGKIVMKPYDLSSLENNLMVVKILEAAIQSAETGKRIYLPKN
ncbi:Gfo/Idh/MocA family protein [Bacteroidota bacterium]